MRRLPLGLTLAALALLAVLCCRPEPRPTVAIWPRSPGFGIAEIADEEARVRLFRGPERDRLTLDGRELPVSGRVGDVVKWRPEDHPPGLAPRLAWTEELGSRQRWWVDGRPWPWGSGCGALRFDADGHAWTAQQSGQGACVLRDGQEVARFDSILADEGSRLNAGVDGRRGPTLPAFVGRDRQGTWLLMPDGRYGPFERIAGIAYDRDLRHWACFVQHATRGASRGAACWALLRDGRLHGWFDEVDGRRRCDGGPPGSPYFGPAEGQLCWASRQGRRWRVWLNDQSWPLEPGQRPGLLMAADARTLVYCLDRGKSHTTRWFENGRYIGSFSATIICGATGSIDGRYWTLETSTDDGETTTIRCHLGRFGPFRLTGAPDMSEGGRVVWRAESASGQQQLWLDGRPLPGPAPDEYHWLGETLVGAVYRPGGDWGSLDGQISPYFDGDDSRLITCGGHTVYYGRDGAERVLVVDGQPRVRSRELGNLVPLDNGRRWRVTTARPARVSWLATWPDSGLPSTECVAHSPDGRHTATIERRSDWRENVTWYLRTERPHRADRLTPVPYRVLWLVISPDGRHTACATDGLEPQLIVDGRPLLKAEVRQGQFTRDGVLLALTKEQPARLIVVRWPDSRPTRRSP